MEWGKENLIVETEEKQWNDWILLNNISNSSIILNEFWTDLFE